MPARSSFDGILTCLFDQGSLLEKLLTVARETDYDQPLKYYVLALLAQGSSVQCPFSNSANHAAFEQLVSPPLFTGIVIECTHAAFKFLMFGFSLTINVIVLMF